MKGVIDPSLVGYKHTHRESSFQPNEAVTQVARAFSDELIDMHIVCDHPTERNPSKRASCGSRANIEKCAIELIIRRSELQSLLNTHDDSSEHATKIDATQKRIVKLE